MPVNPPAAADTQEGGAGGGPMASSAGWGANEVLPPRKNRGLVTIGASEGERTRHDFARDGVTVFTQLAQGRAT